MVNKRNTFVACGTWACIGGAIWSASPASAQTEQFGLTFWPLGDAILEAPMDRLVVSNIGITGDDGFKVSAGGAPGMEFDVLVDFDGMKLGEIVRLGILRSDGTFSMSITDQKIEPDLLQVTSEFSDLSPAFRTVEAYLDGALMGRVDHSGSWDAQIHTGDVTLGKHRDVITGQDNTQIGVWVADIIAGSVLMVNLPDGSVVECNELRFSAVNMGVILPPPADFAWTFAALPEFTVVGARVLPSDCYADCDGSSLLDFFDFLCFQNLFAAGDPEADCDESGSLDFFDFLCFQNAFAEGCP